MRCTQLPLELEEIRTQVEDAARECGLDFFPVQFHMLEFEKLNEVTANIGFPKRYVHWRFGMEYKKLMKELGYGFKRIYELVINTDPAVAYLLSYNKPVQQKMVMAHVYGHVDFFKNNLAFANTNRNMLNTMADHAELIGEYYEKHGLNEVEQFIDSVLSIENLVDPFFDKIKKPEKKKEGENEKKKEVEHPAIAPYLEDFVQDLFREKKENKEKPANALEAEGDTDVLQFIINNAEHLTKWQRDIISIIREERCYFIPQIQTKIMNEGWATFWHSYLMSSKGLAGAGIFEYAETHAGVVGSLIPPEGKFQLDFNPYALGFMLFKDIKERWDSGRYGVAYEDERDTEKKRAWDTKEMGGLKKIFEVRKYKTDAGFIREFFTDDFIREHLFFRYGADPSDTYDIIKSKDPEEIRNLVVEMVATHGEPIIEAVDANFKNNRFLLLRHVHQGLDLHPHYTQATMKNIYKIWQRPVFLLTAEEDKSIIIVYDGKELKKKELKE